MKFIRSMFVTLFIAGFVGVSVVPVSAAPAPVTAEASAAIYVPTEFYNYSDMGVRTRISRVVNGATEEMVVTVMPGESVTGQDGWRLVQFAIADNHYAQINVVSSTDGQSRWYNIWGPWTVTDDNKRKVILSTYRYSTSSKHAVIEQVT